MKLVITIDTEEDNWGYYSPNGHTLRNIERIPVLQEIFDEFGAKPTYLITYPVVTDKSAKRILRSILQSGRCEIGAHCHPWNTPPFDERMCPENSMLCNLSADLQYQKIKSLDEIIQEQFSVKPISFRAGRWGYNATVGTNLCKLGYKIDTSVTPHTTWTKMHGPDFSNASPQSFTFIPNEVLISKGGCSQSLLEIPATIGYVQSRFPIVKIISKLMPVKTLNQLRTHTLASKLGFPSRVWLSPEMSDLKSMILLSRQMISSGYDILNLFFHSPSLQAGLSPFVCTKKDEGRFLNRIRKFLSFAQNDRMTFVTLSEIADAREKGTQG